MTNIERIKAQYDALELGYDQAMAYLEAFGLTEEQADNYLHPLKR